MPTDCLLCALWEPTPSAEKTVASGKRLSPGRFRQCIDVLPIQSSLHLHASSAHADGNLLAVDLIHHAISAHRVIRPTVRLWRMLSTDSRLVSRCRGRWASPARRGSRLKLPFQSGT